jgi:nitric oxide reductase activation protein
MEDDVQEEVADISVDDRQVVDVSDENNELWPSREEQVEASTAARLEQKRGRKKDEQEEKRPKKSSRIESMMEKYLVMRTKQVEDERSELSKEKEVAQGDDFSIKRCFCAEHNGRDYTGEGKSIWCIQKQRKQRDFSECME